MLVIGWVECTLCGHGWCAARHAENTDNLECPACGYHGQVEELGGCC